MVLTAWASLAVLGVYFWTWANAARARRKPSGPSIEGAGTS